MPTGRGGWGERGKRWGEVLAAWEDMMKAATMMIFLFLGWRWQFIFLGEVGEEE
jgi:hypothetical protein